MDKLNTTGSLAVLRILLQRGAPAPHETLFSTWGIHRLAITPRICGIFYCSVLRDMSITHQRVAVRLLVQLNHQWLLRRCVIKSNKDWGIPYRWGEY